MARDGRAGNELLLELPQLRHMPLFHSQDEPGCVLLVVGHAAVPLHVELLELEHVRLLHAQALRQLPRAHGLAATVLFVHAQLVQARARDVCLHVLALALAVEPVLLQNRDEVLQSATQAWRTCKKSQRENAALRRAG